MLNNPEATSETTRESNNFLNNIFGENFDLNELIESLKEGLEDFINSLSQMFGGTAIFEDQDEVTADNVADQDEAIQTAAENQNTSEYATAHDLAELNNLRETPKEVGPMYNLQRRIILNGRTIYSMNLPGVDSNNNEISSDYAGNDGIPNSELFRKIQTDLEFLRDQAGVSHMIGFQDAADLSPIANQIDGISYWPFKLHSANPPHENNLEAYAAVHSAMHKASGNVCTHCRNGRHRARTSIIIGYICDNPPAEELNLEGLDYRNPNNQENIDNYLHDCMTACGIPSADHNYLTNEGMDYLQVHMRLFATNSEARQNLLNRSNEINPASYQPDSHFSD